jgi:DNA-binding protein HU-beta
LERQEQIELFPDKGFVRAGGVAGSATFPKEIGFMAKATTSDGPKPMTKAEITAAMAETVGISKKQVNQFFEAQAELAYSQAKNSFVIPGLGKLVLAERPARQMTMRFGPRAGQVIEVPKKNVLKFRIAKAAKDAILGNKK